MEKRVELNEQQLEDVNGGAFQFYTASDGSSRCFVDDVGDYQSIPNGFFAYINLKNANPDANGAELFDLCVAEGIIIL